MKKIYNLEAFLSSPPEYADKVVEIFVKNNNGPQLGIIRKEGEELICEFFAQQNEFTFKTEELTKILNRAKKELL